MLYRWNVKKPVEDDGKIDVIVDKYHLNPILAQLLIDRTIDTPQKIDAFMEPDLNKLHDPFLLKGMDTAVERLIKALREGENILVYGDYDVDGTTSVSLVYEALFDLGGKISFYIPNRITEGYGLSKDGIDLAKRKNAELIVTVDCGITAVEEVDYANSLGIDVIVCDHHVVTEEIPRACAVLNPKLPDSGYPFSELAGVGVAFKLIQALNLKLGYSLSKIEKYLDLVAIGTAADIVPLLDENRILVKFGLEKINTNPRFGVFALLESSQLLGREIDVSLIVFVLAPRINAVGRMSNAKKAVHLMTSSSLQQARNIAKILESENKIRRGVDDKTCQEAIKLVEETIDIEQNKIIVLAKYDWHPGVIGIVASRIMEKYNRPTILISVSDGIGKGSARSTLNFDMYSILNSANHLLENFGGHKFAAGLTVREENIKHLKKFLEDQSQDLISKDDLTPTLEIEAEISLREFDAQFLSWLKLFAPYGPENMKPVFMSKSVDIIGNVNVVGNNHLKLKVKQDGIVIDAIAYNFGEFINQINSSGRKIDTAYVMEENTWNGQTTIQMRIKDFKIL